MKMEIKLIIRIILLSLIGLSFLMNINLLSEDSPSFSIGFIFGHIIMISLVIYFTGKKKLKESSDEDNEPGFINYITDKEIIKLIEKQSLKQQQNQENLQGEG